MVAFGDSSDQHFGHAFQAGEFECLAIRLVVTPGFLPLRVPVPRSAAPSGHHDSTKSAEDPFKSGGGRTSAVSAT